MAAAGLELIRPGSFDWICGEKERENLWSVEERSKKGPDRSLVNRIT